MCHVRTAVQWGARPHQGAPPPQPLPRAGAAAVRAVRPARPARALQAGARAARAGQCAASACSACQCLKPPRARLQAWDWQHQQLERALAARQQGGGAGPADALFIMQHEPVYTLGTGSSEGHVLFDPAASCVPLYRTERGGEVTYHGPGQVGLRACVHSRLPPRRQLRPSQHPARPTSLWPHAYAAPAAPRTVPPHACVHAARDVPAAAPGRPRLARASGFARVHEEVRGQPCDTRAACGCAGNGPCCRLRPARSTVVHRALLCGAACGAHHCGARGAMCAAWRRW